MRHRGNYILYSNEAYTSVLRTLGIQLDPRGETTRWQEVRELTCAKRYIIAVPLLALGSSHIENAMSEVDTKPFVNRATGLPCTVYIERDGAKMFSGGLEDMIMVSDDFGCACFRRGLMLCTTTSRMGVESVSRRCPNLDSETDGC